MILAQRHHELERRALVDANPVLGHACDCNLIACLNVADQIDRRTLDQFLRSLLRRFKDAPVRGGQPLDNLRRAEAGLVRPRLVTVAKVAASSWQLDVNAACLLAFLLCVLIILPGLAPVRACGAVAAGRLAPVCRLTPPRRRVVVGARLYLPLLGVDQALHVVYLVGSVLDQLQEPFIFLFQHALPALHLFIFFKYSEVYCSQLLRAVVALELPSGQCESALLRAERRLVGTLLGQVELEVLAEDLRLALGVVDALGAGFRAVVVHVVEVLPPGQLFAALLTFQEHELALLPQVLPQLDLEYVFEAELAYFKAVGTLLAVLGHPSSCDPGLTA